ncbi:hypothetical protein OIE52_46065 [Streptomyces canus]|uniref:hypothetical protein n=1 Tax=Streptomyces canus TaxID=58343 RepID=UPI00324AC8A6
MAHVDFEGGVILEHASQRWIFLPSLALGVVTLVVGAVARRGDDRLRSGGPHGTHERVEAGPYGLRSWPP